ncbi:MAG: tetraacyldisaccharide 4'-kinase [Alphaproteobacteria bacterium]|nr:tetraacyldisaccharide 4'-kinase [Alphaproteobacteria bacterium]
MRAPDFWYRPRDTEAQLLSPLGWLYAAAGRMRRAMATPSKASVPVICIGNLTVGGTGKTPVAIAIAKRVEALGMKPGFLTRAYGAHIKGPMAVDPTLDDATTVSDEPLLLAAHAVTVCSPDRPAGARLLVSKRVQAIIMDDGFQNPRLQKDLSLIVVDAERGFGNGEVIPAGPLRERVADGLARAQGVVLMGEGEVDLPVPLPVFRAKLVPLDEDAALVRNQRVAAFAGIGMPDKFFATLANLGATLAIARPFPDHHPYKDDELIDLLNAATAANAQLITTEKDWVRISPAFRDRIRALRVRVQFDRASAPLLDTLISKCLKPQA